MRSISLCAFALGLAATATVSTAQDAQPRDVEDEASDGGYWRLMVSPFTQHFSNEDDAQHEYVYMVGLERRLEDGWVWGGSYFSNSFGQPSGYVYFGRRYSGFSAWSELFAQWTLGIVYGYKPPFEDRVPFNHHGFAPTGTLSLGWQFTRQFSMQANLLGTAAVMLQLSWDFR